MLILRIVILVMLICLPSLVTATGQVPDTMTYEDAVYPVHGFTLTDQMVSSLQNYRDSSICAAGSSANWNGFYAELSLRDKKLFLHSLSTDWDDRPSSNCKPPTVKEAFGIYIPSGGMHAKWFIGRLVNGYGSCSDLSCSHYHLYYFERGVLTKVDNKNREEYFEEISRENRTKK